jgi:hypothetical protein
MNKRFLVGMVVMTSLTGAAVPVLAANTAPPAANKPGKAAKGEHPRLQAALKHLQRTKQELTNAPHEFGGHRAKALQAVDTAIAEVNEALKVKE